MSRRSHPHVRIIRQPDLLAFASGLHSHGSQEAGQGPVLCGVPRGRVALVLLPRNQPQSQGNLAPLPEADLLGTPLGDDAARPVGACFHLPQVSRDMEGLSEHRHGGRGGDAREHQALRLQQLHFQGFLEVLALVPARVGPAVHVHPARGARDPGCNCVGHFPLYRSMA